MKRNAGLHLVTVTHREVVETDLGHAVLGMIEHSENQSCMARWLRASFSAVRFLFNESKPLDANLGAVARALLRERFLRDQNLLCSA
jgi:hypothetical protein